MRESFLDFLNNDLLAGELGTDANGLFSISIDTFSVTGVLNNILINHTY